MEFDNKTTQRHRGIFGTGLASWLLLLICMVAPEWTREDDKHCGVFFCCSDYGNCTITDSEVVSNPLPWVLSGWLFSFVGVCSALCRCSNVHPENVRHMAIMSVVSGILTITGSSQFIAQKFTSSFARVNFGACGFLTHIAGWMLFISGCSGFCHGYGYYSMEYENQVKRQISPARYGRGNEIYPVNDDMMEMARVPSPYHQVASPATSGSGQASRLSRFRENILPSNFARRFWRDAVAATNETLDQQAGDRRTKKS